MAKKVMNNPYSRFYGLCNQLGFSMESRRDAISSICNNRTLSIKELSPKEFERLLFFLMEAEHKQNQPMRGKIIYYLINLGYVTDNGLPDWERINNYVATHCGSGNPKRKILNKMNTTELRAVLLVVQQFYKTKFPDAITGATKQKV